MPYEDDILKSAWLGRKQGSSTVDENAVAAWLERDCPQDEAVESALADNPTAREAVSSLRLEGTQPLLAEPVPAATQQRLLAGVMDVFQPGITHPDRSPVIGSVGMRMAAAAAAIAVAALGFSFGRVAAPATNQATNDFVTVVTFDMLTEDDHLDSILMGTALAVDVVSEGNAP